MYIELVIGYYLSPNSMSVLAFELKGTYTIKKLNIGVHFWYGEINSLREFKKNFKDPCFPRYKEKI